jgi:hypothetical protein
LPSPGIFQGPCGASGPLRQDPAAGSSGTVCKVVNGALGGR